MRFSRAETVDINPLSTIRQEDIRIDHSPSLKSSFKLNEPPQDFIRKSMTGGNFPDEKWDVTPGPPDQLEKQADLSIEAD